MRVGEGRWRCAHRAAIAHEAETVFHTGHCRRSLRIRGLKLTAGAPTGAPRGRKPAELLTSCCPGRGGAPLQTAPAGSRWAPAQRTTWQWQLTGTLDQSVPADMYDLDLFDTPASTVATLHGQGRRVTCYIDAGF